MNAWKKVWREGIAPLLSDGQLHALRAALAGDDPRLVQGRTTVPYPVMAAPDAPAEGACALGFCGMAAGLETVDEVDEFFARTCYEIDRRVGEPAGCRWFLNWYDETPRAEMRVELLREVRIELGRRIIGEAVKGVADAEAHA